jgi:2-methylcitrate dehydratase PrpD
LRKPWASCAYTHRAIAAALEIAGRPGFDPARVASVEVHMPEPYVRVCGISDPKSSSEARFSVACCIAVALVDRVVRASSFQPDSFNRPAIRAIQSMITPVPYPLAPHLGDMSPEAPDRLVVRLSDGTTLSETVAHVRGGPNAPLSEIEILAKFEDLDMRTRAKALLVCAGTRSFRWSDPMA